MKRWLRIIIASIAILFYAATPVCAATITEVTITATPMTSAGIIDFTVIYVSDTRLDFTWSFAPGTTNIMIRAKYGEYPDDIPDINTAPSDGYLVYYGNGITTNDTSMDFDDNPGYLFYKAWGQNADGTWQMATSTGAEESRAMQLIAIIILASVMAYFSLRSSNILLGLLASMPWILLFLYIKANPIAGIEAGSLGNDLIYYICWLMAIILPLVAIVRRKREREYFGEGGGSVEWGESRKLEKGERQRKISQMDADLLAYRSKVRVALRKKA